MEGQRTKRSSPRQRRRRPPSVFQEQTTSRTMRRASSHHLDEGRLDSLGTKKISITESFSGLRPLGRLEATRVFCRRQIRPGIRRSQPPYMKRCRRCCRRCRWLPRLLTKSLRSGSTTNRLHPSPLAPSRRRIIAHGESVGRPDEGSLNELKPSFLPAHLRALPTRQPTHQSPYPPPQRWWRRVRAGLAYRPPRRHAQVGAGLGAGRLRGVSAAAAATGPAPRGRRVRIRVSRWRPRPDHPLAQGHADHAAGRGPGALVLSGAVLPRRAEQPGHAAAEAGRWTPTTASSRPWSWPPPGWR